MVIILLNAAAQDSAFDLSVSLPNDIVLVDLLNPPDEFHVSGGRLCVGSVHKNWARILKVKG